MSASRIERAMIVEKGDAKPTPGAKKRKAPAKR
jgi:hypothetical protein